MNEKLGIRVMIDADVDAASTLLATQFSQFDPLALALDLSVDDMRAMIAPLITAAIEDELSVVAYDSDNPNRLLGCVLSERMGAPPPKSWSADLLERFGAVFGLIAELHKDYFQQLSPNLKQKFIHEAMVATDQVAAGRGIAQRLLRASAINARSKGFDGAVAELTGPISQHIFIKKNGYQAVATVAYKSFKFKGERPFANIGTIDRCVLSIKSY